MKVFFLMFKDIQEKKIMILIIFEVLLNKNILTLISCGHKNKFYFT